MFLVDLLSRWFSRFDRADLHHDADPLAPAEARSATLTRWDADLS